jgi:hypothetical protein
VARRLMVSEEQVRRYAMRYEGQPYALGANDCFLMCLRWADKMRGESVRKTYSYHGIKGALATLKQHNVKSSCYLFDRHYTRTTEPRAGDLCGWVNDHIGACGIVLRDGVQLSISECGDLEQITDEQPNLFWSLSDG